MCYSVVLLYWKLEWSGVFLYKDRLFLKVKQMVNTIKNLISSDSNKYFPPDIHCQRPNGIYNFKCLSVVK